MDSINVLIQQGGNNARICMLKVIMLLHHTLYHKKRDSYVYNGTYVFALGEFRVQPLLRPSQ